MYQLFYKCNEARVSEGRTIELNKCFEVNETPIKKGFLFFFVTVLYNESIFFDIIRLFVQLETLLILYLIYLKNEVMDISNALASDTYPMLVSVRLSFAIAWLR